MSLARGETALSFTTRCRSHSQAPLPWHVFSFRQHECADVDIVFGDFLHNITLEEHEMSREKYPSEISHDGSNTPWMLDRGVDVILAE